VYVNTLTIQDILAELEWVRLVGRECGSLAPLTIRGVRGPWSVVLREVVLRRCGRRQEKRGGIPKSALLGSVD
jgi:hypothetical protein